MTRAKRVAATMSRLRMRCLTRGSACVAMESSRMPRPMRSAAKRAPRTFPIPPITTARPGTRHDPCYARRPRRVGQVRAVGAAPGIDPKPNHPRSLPVNCGTVLAVAVLVSSVAVVAPAPPVVLAPAPPVRVRVPVALPARVGA